MSARDELIESMLPTLNSPSRGEEEAVNRLIDAFAHELAEQQREALGTTDDPLYYGLSAGWLIDLIDPERNSG